MKTAIDSWNTNEAVAQSKYDTAMSLALSKWNAANDTAYAIYSTAYDNALSLTDTSLSLDGDDDLSFVCYVDPNVPAAPAAPGAAPALSGEDDEKFIRVMELVKQRRPDLYQLAVRVEFVTCVSDPNFFSSSTGFEYDFGPGHRPSITIYKHATDDDAATFVIQALGEYIVLQNKVNDAVLQNIKKSKEPHDDLGVLLRKLDAPGPTTNTKLGTWEGLEYNRAFSLSHEQVISLGIIVGLDVILTLTGGKVAEFASHLTSTGWKLVRTAEGAPLRWLNPSGRLATKLDLETAAREFASAGKKGTPKTPPATASHPQPGGGAGAQSGAASASQAVPRGGTYIIRDPATGRVMRTGRTNDLARRQQEHLRDPALRDYEFEVAHRTDVYAEQRGLEQLLHETHTPSLNRISGIDPKNPRLVEYRDAARRFLEGQQRGN